MTESPLAQAGHAFISYVHEDTTRVDRVERVLKAAGIRVWRDTAELWPGEDWRLKIRNAITNDSLVFIACFSEASEARDVSYQNEELVLAVEQFRMRSPHRAWLIPVRFSDCPVPDFDLGAGRTLNSLHRVDLFGPGEEEGVAKLIAGTLRALGEANLGAAAAKEAIQSLSESVEGSASVDLAKSAPIDPQRQIELAEFVRDESIRAATSDVNIVNGRAVHASAAGSRRSLPWFSALVGIVAAVAAGYLVWVQLNPASGFALLEWASILVVGLVAVGSSIARLVRMYTVERFAKRRVQVGGILKSLAWAVHYSTDGRVPVQPLGASAYVVVGFGPFQWLHRLTHERINETPGPTLDIRWTKGKGILGVAWASGRTQCVNTGRFDAQHAQCTMYEWNMIGEAERRGLTYYEYKHVAGSGLSHS